MKLTRKKIGYVILTTVIIVLVGWMLYSQYENINQLRSEGKDYSIGAVTVKNGKDGLSAYELAVKNEHFVGTEAEWLLSLIVAPIKGADGSPGPSAYQIAVNEGFKGSAVEWLQSLKGQDAPSLTSKEILAMFDTYCADGRCQGVAGLDGTNGINGKNAVLRVWACVERTNPLATPPAKTLTTRWYAWKYDNELDTAYRDQFSLPEDSICTTTVNMTGV